VDALEDELQGLALRGIFPGPSESSGDFFARAHLLMPQDNQGNLPAMKILNKIFHASPDWVQGTIGSKGLPFWEGAATWIEENAEGMRLCRIQLRETFLTRLYPKDELIAHEMVHAMRVMFDEKRFEEILAYQTSKNRFRRYFGPLFSNPLEVSFFLALWLISWGVYLAEMLFDVYLGGDLILCLPLLALGWGVIRLVRSQRLFSAALRNLGIALGNRVQPQAVAIRLTDAEIEQFAASTPQEICAFVEGVQGHNLRLMPFFSLVRRRNLER
jgi:hypothetical protein